MNYHKNDPQPPMYDYEPMITPPPQNFPFWITQNTGRPPDPSVPSHGQFFEASNTFGDTLPCKTYQNWDYDQCYNYYSNGCYNTCQFVNVIDIEDFMNNEKRKEKSRDAARCRRSRETEIFSDLAGSLPLAKDQISQLDKASIMRLAISYLRVRDMINIVPKLAVHKQASFKLDESIFLNSLEGFLFVISLEGDFIYLSENVCEYIGITQIDLMGQSVYEFAHPCDHDEIKDMLVSRHNDEDNATRSFFIRFKCTLTNKGRSVNIKSATYKVIHCTGHMLHKSEKPSGNDDIKIEDQVEEAVSSSNSVEYCLVAVGKPIEHPENIETPLGRGNFLSKHTLDMKFTYADERMMEIMGYDPDELIGKSLYEYYHAMDSDVVCGAFKALFSKGQCETARYRFLARRGGYVWILTQATLINDKGRKPTSIVCVNYLISGIECKDKIYSYAQACAAESSPVEDSPPSLEVVIEEDITKESSLKEVEEVNNNEVKDVIETGDDQEEVLVVTLVDTDDKDQDESASSLSSPTTTSNSSQPEASVSVVVCPKEVSPPLVPPAYQSSFPIFRNLTATSKLFAPRTEDMNKGFLMFSDTESGVTMLKDEPDDLTHLAPVAGECVALNDDNSHLLTEILDDFLLRDDFSPLLTDEPCDPFISYRESDDLSPQMLSPNLSKRSDSSLPSLNSPSGSLGDEDQMSTFMTLQMDDEDSELLMKTAPSYMPINIGDDLPLLMSDEYMWNANINEKITGTNRNGPDINSSLAQLLCSNNSSKNNDQNNTNSGGGGKMNGRDILNNLYNNNDENGNKNWNNVRNSSTRSQKSARITQDQNLSHNKRTNSSTVYETSSKRCKNEPKEKMSSELLQQLMSNNVQRGRPKGGKGSNWLLDSGQKATCISQPSESVLMNLLDQPMNDDPSSPKINEKLTSQTILVAPPPQSNIRSSHSPGKPLRNNSVSFSLLDPEAGISDIFDLTQQDYEVNAPVDNSLLQGSDLLIALEATHGTI